MKKFLAIAAVIAAIFSFGSIETQAGFPLNDSRILSDCGHCHQPIFAFYRPIRWENSNAIYGWVPSYHRHSGLALRGTGSLRYNYGYRSHSVHQDAHDHRSLHGYRSSRSFDPVRGRVYGTNR